MNVTFKECHISLTSLIDALQGTNAVVNACCLDDTTSDSSNLTATEEGVTNHATIHLQIGDIHHVIDKDVYGAGRFIDCGRAGVFSRGITHPFHLKGCNLCVNDGIGDVVHDGTAKECKK